MLVVFRDSIPSIGEASTAERDAIVFPALNGKHYITHHGDDSLGTRYALVVSAACDQEINTHECYTHTKKVPTHLR